ncbi:MAG: fumarate hydratase [Victivallales bacterium]|nr:fumarate hydratase [Victivallales bacterium]
MCDFYQQILDLITAASTILPEDVENALRKSAAAEAPDSPAAAVMEQICCNLDLGRQNQQPLCQDTGVIHFFVEAPEIFPRRRFAEEARRAVVEATRLGLLRQNCVESVSGKNTGNNLGYINPTFHWEDREDDAQEVKVTLLLKGGGSENVGRQYTLPDNELGAGRDLEGVRKCVLDAVWRAQGMGCAPGILGVCIGGDRAGGAEEAKKQLLRNIGERSANPAHAELESRLLAEANSMDIGPMGMGGRTTLLDVFIGSRSRHPASYFVTVCYNCWCCRRRSTVIKL